MKPQRVLSARPAREPERKARPDPAGHATPDFAHLLLSLPHLPLPKAVPLPHLAPATPGPAASKAGPPPPVARRAPEERRAAAPTPTTVGGALAAVVTPDSQPTQKIEAPTAAFAAHLEEDPAMRVTMTPNTAAMKVQTADGNDVSLYLRIRDGSAQLRIDGASAQVEHRSDELRVALANEGISLQRLEVHSVGAASEASGTSLFADGRDRDRAPPDRPELPEAPAPTAAVAASPSSSLPHPTSGLHVRA